MVDEEEEEEGWGGGRKAWQQLYTVWASECQRGWLDIKRLVMGYERGVCLLYRSKMQIYHLGKDF